MSATKERSITREPDLELKPNDNEKNIIPADDLALLELLADVIFEQILNTEKENT